MNIIKFIILECAIRIQVKNKINIFISNIKQFNLKIFKIFGINNFKYVDNMYLFQYTILNNLKIKY